MAEYITKQQVIDLVKSMEVLIGCTGVSVLTKGIEGLETQHWVKFFNTDIGSVCEPIDGVWYRTPKE